MNSNVIKTINYIKRNGLVKGGYAIAERLEDRHRDNDYTYVPISDEEARSQIEEGKTLNYTFSLLVPAYETNPQYMRELIDSVIAQTYAGWQLVIVDASKSDIVKATVKEYQDDRIVLINIDTNEGISANSNLGLPYCDGEYTGLLDHDDVLTKDALFQMVQRIDAERKNGHSPKMLYSDEDKTDSFMSSFFDAHIKRDFDLDLLMSNNYICHFLVVKTRYLKDLRFDREFDGAQDHDLILRVVSKLRNKYGKEYNKYICHIPRVLYHWRCHENSTAANPKSKLYAYEAGKRAIEAFIKREKLNATVRELPHMGFFYVDYDPEVLEQRPEIAAIGYRVYNKRHKIVDGVYDENMKLMFDGLNKNFSGGIFHRAAVSQSVPYINVKYMKASQMARQLLDKIAKEEGININTAGTKEYITLSRRFCDTIRGMGFMLLYDPSVAKKEI